MFYRPQRRRIRIRGILWMLVFLLLIAAGVVAYLRLTGERPIEERIVQLPGKGDGAVSAYADGVLCVDDKQLVCSDAAGNTLWQINLPLSGMKAARRGDYTIAWGGNTVCIIDAAGIMQDVKELSGDVLLGRMGKNQYACVTVEEGQHRLHVYNMDGSDLDEERFPDKTVLAADYYGDAMDQLWVLSVDSHGTLPVSRVNTYQPGKRTTGGVSAVDEVGYRVQVVDKRIYYAGSHHIYVWEQSGDVVSELSVYGWNLQDMVATAQGVSYLLAPSTPYGQPIGALWYIAADGTQNTISLPAGCTQALIGSKSLLAITADGFYSMTTNGSTIRSHKLPFEMDGVAAVIEGKAFVARAGHSLYLVPVS
ncbi:MAG: hypothetical protein PHO66_02545 [Eubacteriales bacterium]|nr:hypothetical protein [Eubacteriales bacterium]